MSAVEIPVLIVFDCQTIDQAERKMQTLVTMRYNATDSNDTACFFALGYPPKGKFYSDGANFLLEVLTEKADKEIQKRAENSPEDYELSG